MVQNQTPYWTGKKRDSNTLKQLSKSKYKKIVQYDEDGYLVKIWDSAKDVASKIFNDYKVKDGSGNTKFYGYLSSPNLKTRFKKGYYWIKLEEFVDNKAPQFIDIQYILDKQKKEYNERVSISRKKSKKVKTCQNIPIFEINPITKKIIGRYPSAKIAGEKLNIQPSSINRICRYLNISTIDGRVFIFKNLEQRKKYQHNIDKRIAKQKQIKENKLKRENRYVSKFKRPVIAYEECTNITFKEFTTLTFAADYFKLKAKDIYYLIDNDFSYKGYKFKYNGCNS